jgi:3-dehydroquinate dehydratase type I
MTRLVAVLPFSEATTQDDLAACDLNGAEGLELRLDFWAGSAAELAEKLRSLTFATEYIATARLAADGGQYPARDARRLELLRAAAQSGAWLIDLEVGTDKERATAVVEGATAEILWSHHDRLATSARALTDLLDTLTHDGAKHVKLATHAARLTDNLVHRDLLRRKWPFMLSAFCTGATGLPSRLLGDVWNSELVYSRAPGAAAASLLPELPPLDALTRVFRLGEGHVLAIKSVDGNKTLVESMQPRWLFGVTGSHVTGSLSPYIHNICFDIGLAAARYIPLQSSDFSDVLTFAEAAEFAGLSVTAPFKADALQAGSIGESADKGDLGRFPAESVGAANTLSRAGAKALPLPGDPDPPRNPNARWFASNTDVSAIAAAMVRLLPEGKADRARILLLGAGGSARAALRFLAENFKSVAVHARNRQAAKTLASESGFAYHPDPCADEDGWDVVINCTPAGGPAAPDDLPVDFARLPMSTGGAVLDLTYGPTPSKLVRMARERGIRAEDGLSVLLAQAILQQQQWQFGMNPDPEAFRRQMTPLTGAGLPMLAAGLRRAASGGPVSNPFRVAIVGHRGAGKTALGAAVAKRLELRSIETDEYIRLSKKKPVSEVFAELGERDFRELEKAAFIACAIAPTPCIIPTGGGIVENRDCRRLIRAQCTVVYLEVPEDVLIARLRADDTRPALEPGMSLEEETRTRLAKRLPHWRAMADYTLDGSRATTAELARQLTDWLLRMG